MTQEKDPKAAVNPAARHDEPGGPEPVEQQPRTPQEQVKAKQSADLNPLDPGGIGE
jgi:hypothetical protein